MSMSPFTALNQLNDYLSKVIIGQEHLLERLLIALLADGHLLVEGAPGLAKTKAIKDLARGLEAEFQRIPVHTGPATLLISPAQKSIARKTAVSGSSRGRSSTTWFWQMRSTGHPPRCSPPLLEAMAEQQVSVGGTNT